MILMRPRNSRKWNIHGASFAMKTQPYDAFLAKATFFVRDAFASVTLIMILKIMSRKITRKNKENF
jgi:hypothetical protein